MARVLTPGQPPGTQVADTCVELLHLEMVDYVLHCKAHEGAKEPIYLTLENMGFEVGHRLMERLTRNRSCFPDTLELMKFLCKEFWTECFRKSVDSLMTNKKGIFQFRDSNFRWLRRVSPSTVFPAISARASGSGDVAMLTPHVRSAADYLIFPAGLIRGALYAMGVQAVVEPILGTLPECTFHITVKSSAP
eukprot:RCo019952